VTLTSRKGGQQQGRNCWNTRAASQPTMFTMFTTFTRGRDCFRTPLKQIVIFGSGWQRRKSQSYPQVTML
jgi:hypothetical protein